MKYEAGCHLIVNNEKLGSAVRIIEIPRDRIFLTVPEGGSADVELGNDTVVISLSGSGRFVVRAERGSFHVTAAGADKELELSGRGTAVVGGVVRLVAHTAVQVEAREEAVVELRDSCRLKAHDRVQATVSGYVRAEMFDSSSVAVNGWAQVTLHRDAVLVGRPSPAARVHRLAD